jgi:hypothetical protein
VARLEPDRADRRLRRAHADRKVCTSADLDGMGQIVAQPGTLFYRLLTDQRGHLLDATELGRFPSDRRGFAIDVRDGTCAWKTCTTRAAACDHDHTVPAPDGPTSADNLGNRCRRHHRAKTHAGFGVHQGARGSFVWTTLAGYRDVVEPEPLPVGRWPAATVIDHHTPLADLIDRTDPEPRRYESEVRDALRPDPGSGPLLRSEIDLILAGPAP